MTPSYCEKWRLDFHKFLISFILYLPRYVVIAFFTRFHMDRIRIYTPIAKFSRFSMDLKSGTSDLSFRGAICVFVLLLESLRVRQFC